MERRPYNPHVLERQAALYAIARNRETKGIIDYMPNELGFQGSSDLLKARNDITVCIQQNKDSQILKAALDKYDVLGIMQAEYLTETKPEQPFALVGFIIKRIPICMQISLYHYEQALKEALDWTAFYDLSKYRSVLQRTLADFQCRQREDNLRRK